MLQPLGVLTIIVFWPANIGFLRFRFACTFMYACASRSRKPYFRHKTLQLSARP